MKKVSLIALLALMMVSFQGMAQEKDPQTVIIRVFEQHIRGTVSQMVITSPDGTIKSIELTNVNLKSFEGNEGNSVIIQSEINSWKNQGFSIDGLSSQSNYIGVMITTIILSKEK